MPRRLFVLLSNAATSPDATAAPEPSKSDSHYDVQVDADASTNIVDRATPAEVSSSERVRHRMWPNLP